MSARDDKVYPTTKGSHNKTGNYTEDNEAKCNVTYSWLGLGLGVTTQSAFWVHLNGFGVDVAVSLQPRIDGAGFRNTPFKRVKLTGTSILRSFLYWESLINQMLWHFLPSPVLGGSSRLQTAVRKWQGCNALRMFGIKRPDTPLSRSYCTSHSSCCLR